MTIKEALEVFQQEDHSIKTLLDPETGDIYIAKLTDLGTVPLPPTILAWVCGQEADRFISYEGLNKKASYRALSTLAETLPTEREDK